jgi:adenylate cyclase
MARTLAAALIVGAVAAAAQLLGVGRELELRTVDLRFDVRGVSSEEPAVVFVRMDGASLRHLRRASYPLPRSVHARVIDELRGAGARAIAYDVSFLGLSRRRDDVALTRALERAGNTALATDRVDDRGRTDILGGDALLRAVHARPAHAGAPPDPGAVVRRMAVAVDGLPTLALAGAEIARGRRLDAPSDTPWIDFAGPSGSLPTLPLWRVAEGRFDRSLVRGRAVVVGPGRELEVHPTSVGDMGGGEIQANALRTALRDFPLREPPAWLRAFAVLLLGAVVTAAGMRTRPLIAAVLGLVALAGVAAAAQLAFQGGTLLPVVAPAFAVGLASVVASSRRSAAQTLRRFRRRFAQYVPEAVVDEVLALRDGHQQAPVALDATVLFADLRGFTAFSERLPPSETGRVLSRYLSEMTDAITEHGGTVVDLMGDGVMAVFGAPRPLDDHADRALGAARDMLETRLPRFNAAMREEGATEPFRIGIGVNSGTVLSGSLGSEQRLTYSAIGDTTNTASRLEALTKELGRPLAVAASTVEALSAPGDWGLEPAGERQIRGRKDALRVWIGG